MSKLVMPFLWLGLALVMGIMTFHVSQEVQHTERALRSLNREIVSHEHSERVLRAEWYYLTEPQRLREMAKEFLPELVPMTGEQMALMQEVEVKVASLLPPPETTESVAAAAEGAIKEVSAVEGSAGEDVTNKKTDAENSMLEEPITRDPARPVMVEGPAPLETQSVKPSASQVMIEKARPADKTPPVAGREKDFADVLKALEQKAAP
jgi:hypothetical protein